MRSPQQQAIWESVLKKNTARLKVTTVQLARLIPEDWTKHETLVSSLLLAEGIAGEMAEKDPTFQTMQDGLQVLTKGLVEAKTISDYFEKVEAN